jgi:hypothetical protein
MCPPLAESTGQDVIQASAGSAEATLEAEIAALVAAAAREGLRARPADEAAHTDQMDVQPECVGSIEVDQYPGKSTNHIDADVSESCREPPTWDAGIRISDEERILTSSSDRRASRTAVVLGALLILGIGWISGVISQQFFAFGHKVQSQRSLLGAKNQAASGRIDTGRNANTAASNIDKNALVTGSIPAHRLSPAEIAAAQQIGVTKSSPVSQQTAVPASTGAAIGPGPSAPNWTSFPETKPTTIDGWTVREVVGGAAILEGPDGVWKVTRGDTVPGVGRVESIVRWGSRLIVATSMGLISTP